MCKRKSVGCECRREGASRAAGGEYEEESSVFRGVVDFCIEKEWSWQTFFRKMFRLRGDHFSIVLIPKTRMTSSIAAAAVPAGAPLTPGVDSFTSSDAGLADPAYYALLVADAAYSY